MIETLLLDGSRAEDVRAAARIIDRGGVLAVPTDTVYGFAAGVLDDGPVERIFELKRRPAGQAMPVLLASARDASLVAAQVPRDVWPLIDHFWPGPLTLVLPARPSLSRTVTGGLATVGIRVPGGRVILELLEATGVPLTGTSANVHGRAPAATAAEALEQFAGRVDAVLTDPDSQPLGQPSTVVEFLDGAFIVHRAGAVSADQLRQALGPRARVQVTS